MAKLLLIPSLLILCVSAASGQEAPPEPPAKDSKGREIILQCRPQKPLSHTWICTDQHGNERNNLQIKDRDAK